MGGRSQTTTQSNNPWAPAQPLLNQTLGGMQSWLNSPDAFKAYQGPYYAGMSGQTQQGLDALGGAGGATRGFLDQTMSGKYLDAGNPHLQALQSRAMADVMPGINSTFGKSGMTGSTLHQGSLARGVGDAMAPGLFQNYENERNRQMAAAGQMYGMDRQGALDQIMGGQLREGYDQRGLDEARMKWEQNRMAGLRGYQDVFPMLSGIAGMGGTSQGTTTQQTPWWQTALGAGMMGVGALSGFPMMGMGGLFGGSPYSNPYGFANPSQRA